MSECVVAISMVRLVFVDAQYSGKSWKACILMGLTNHCDRFDGTPSIPPNLLHLAFSVVSAERSLRVNKHAVFMLDSVCQ